MKLTEQEKQSILQGLADADAGRLRPAKEVFAELHEEIRVAELKIQSEKGARHGRKVRRPSLVAS